MKHMWHLAALAIGCGTMAPQGPELTGESFTLTWGPRLIEPGVEGTECVILDVGNDAPIRVHEIENTLAAISHHLVVYRDDAAVAPVTTPFPCTPFAGTLSPTAATSPLMITQKEHDVLALPSGVAYTFNPHQLIRVEMHYLNPGDVAVDATATVEFRAGTPELIRDEASFMFIGTPDVELPPNQASSVSTFFTPPETLAGARFYAITGHTHKLGTNVTIATAPTRDAARTMVYAPAEFAWSEPPTERHETAFVVPVGGVFDFTCDYYNPTAQTVKFGESATDEMCFFWAYYYPSRGAHICVHSTQVNPPDGVDVCCPAPPGDQLSKFICDKLAEEFD
jgi:hypothetical protein